MKNCGLIIILLWLVVWLSNCTPQKGIGRSTQTLHKRTGETIATEELIQKYEKEHQEFCEKETSNVNELSWPDLEKKNLSNYCRKHLQNSLPTRKNEGVIGNKFKILLYYEKEITRITSRDVIVVQCKMKYKSCHVNYHITRAPEPNCVYTLKRTGNYKMFMYTIMNKYCDFEEKPLINSSLKRKMTEIINKKHPKTGQPIAKDEYLMEYELEHQEFLNKIGINEKQLDWPYAMKHSNLNSYCHQFIAACAPRRHLENITGSWKFDKLHHQKLKTNVYINVTTVTCQLPNISKHYNDVTPNTCKRYYYMTRAPEENCVYALLRQGHNTLCPLVIIFKHCDFEHLSD